MNISNTKGTKLPQVLLDFRVQNVHHLEHNRPDIVVLEKEERACSVMDVACTFDTRVLEKKLGKCKYIMTSNDCSGRCGTVK